MLRVFRNDPRIRYQGVVHERIEPSVEVVARSDGLEIGLCDLRLVHIATQTDEHLKNKNSRYIPLLRKSISREPGRFFSWWHLGECLRLAGDEEGAAATWTAGLSRPRNIEPERGTVGDCILYVSLIELRHRRGEPSDELIAQALSESPDHLSLQWLAAQGAIERGDLESAQPILERLMAVDADTVFEPDIAYNKALFGHLPAQALALCHFRRGRFDEAARLYRIAAQTAPDPDECYVKARLAELRMSTGRQRAGR